MASSEEIDRCTRARFPQPTMAASQMAQLSNEEIEACRAAFANFDKDGSGSISDWELRAMLQCALQLPRMATASTRPPKWNIIFHSFGPPTCRDRSSSSRLTSLLFTRNLVLAAPTPPVRFRGYSYGTGPERRGTFRHDCCRRRRRQR